MILLIIQYRIISCKPIEINSLPGNTLARMDAAGAQTCRALGHRLLHPTILRQLVLLTPANLKPRALLYRTDCTQRSKFLMLAFFLLKTNLTAMNKITGANFNCFF